MSMTLWDRAASLPATVLNRRPELVALPAEPPDFDTLFTFMRDAELRFTTLRLRIEERTWGARGQQVLLHDVLIRHPGEARVTSSEPDLGTRGNYELWITDGTTVRTYSGIHGIATNRPVRPTLAGVDNPDLPPSSRVYHALTSLPMESLPELFVHPGGYLQNVIATGIPTIVTTAEHLGREAIVVHAAHPRATEVWNDRPDYAVELTVDRETGVILRLTESVGEDATRDAVVTMLDVDPVLPPSAFEFKVPPGATILY